MAKKWDINKALRSSGLAAPSRLIMLTLSDLAEAATGVIPQERGPSLREIADWTGLSKASVVRHLDQLEESGWLTRDRPTIEAAQRDHARTGYQLHEGHVSERDKPLSHSDTCQNGQTGQAGLTVRQGMSQTETRHVSHRDQGMSHSETVPYSHEDLTTITNFSSGNAPKTESRRPKRKPVERAERADVTRICEHLADRIVANGCKRPTITKAWREEARLLIDKDGRTEAQIMRCIDWATADPFWKANILSMPKLRAKYDQLSLAAQRQRANGRASPGLIERNGLMLKPETIADIDRTQRFAAMDAQQLAIEGPA